MKIFILLVGLVFLFNACQHSGKYSSSENQRFLSFLDKKFEEKVARYPQFQTYLGRKTNYDKLNDNSEAQSQREHEITTQTLRELQQFDYSKLDPQNQVNYDLFAYNLEESIEGYQWRYHYYSVNQMFGQHSGLPVFLMNRHLVDNIEDAKAYILRIKEIPRVFSNLIAKIEKSASQGVVAPDFVFPLAIQDCQNLISGHPLSNTKNLHPLFRDFKSKLEALKLQDRAQEIELLNDFEKALVGDFKPSYEKLILTLKKLQKKSDSRLGVWKLPMGEEYYRYQLKSVTTLDLKAQEIHELGLREIERIHGEMKVLMRQVGFKGSLQDFFKRMNDDPKMFFEAKNNGEQKYIEYANGIIKTMEKNLNKLFTIVPPASVVVRPVEKFKQKSAAMAYYQSPDPEGRTPGIFYINTYDLKSVPKYEVEALTYHEAIPGHHMQISIAQKLKDLPKFRRFGGFTSYSEGWGLYAERIPKEIGLYQDPYSDFGRLSYELWRAARLVLDTGIHYYKWDRKKAQSYLQDNTPNDEAEIKKAVERYSVIPGQAVAYKIGMNKILELRESATNKLGTKFDIRLFHDEVLKNGPVPLPVLEKNINAWVAQQSSKI